MLCSLKSNFLPHPLSASIPDAIHVQILEFFFLWAKIFQNSIYMSLISICFHFRWVRLTSSIVKGGFAFLQLLKHIHSHIDMYTLFMHTHHNILMLAHVVTL